MVALVVSLGASACKKEEKEKKPRRPPVHVQQTPQQGKPAGKPQGGGEKDPAVGANPVGNWSDGELLLTLLADGTGELFDSPNSTQYAIEWESNGKLEGYFGTSYWEIKDGELSFAFKGKVHTLERQ